MQQQLIHSLKQRSQQYFALKYRFTEKYNNQFELLNNAQQFYPAMIDSILNAKTSIVIIQYIFETSQTTQQFINALIQAAQRGVNTQVIVDAYGSRQLNEEDRQLLKTAGVKIIFFNPLRNYKLIKFLYRDHRKLLVVDQNIAFIGGAGICDDYNYPIDKKNSWDDVVVKVTGDIAKDSYQLSQNTKTVNNLFHSNTNSKQSEHGRLLLSTSWHKNEIQRAIINSIAKTKERVWLTTPYFLPSRKLRRKLIFAAHQGIDVRLLLPGNASDHPWVSHMARYLYRQLLNNGIKIFELDDTFCHAKLIICDNWVCLGSSNLDRWNQKFNRELNIEIQSEKITKDTESFFNSHFNTAREVTLKQWKNRSYTQKAKEWYWSKVAMWIERFIHNLK